MKAEAIKFDLYDKIDHADQRQLEDLYGLITNYFNGDSNADGWESLAAPMQEKLIKSMQQADAGLGISAKDVIKNAREKYRLNG